MAVLRWRQDTDFRFKLLNSQEIWSFVDGVIRSMLLFNSGRVCHIGRNECAAISPGLWIRSMSSAEISG